MTHPQALRIDFVSDVSCPWCAVGLASLENALDALKGEVHAGIHSVPTIIINRQHLISGGQPPVVFEQALRQWAGD